MTSREAPGITSYESHKSEEISFMGDLYKNTNNYLRIFSDKKSSDKVKNFALQQFHQTRIQWLNTKKLAEQRKGLPVNLDFYRDELGKTNPAIFRFLSEEEQTRLKNKLLFTYFLILAQYQLNDAEDRKHSLSKDQEDLVLCAQHIHRLNLAPNVDEKTDPQNDLENEISFFTKCMYYLGLTLIAAWIVERYEEFLSNKTGAFVRWLSEINSKRLYWVWGGGMISSAIGLIPDGFFNTHDAGIAIATPSPITGYMSFVLYYIRLGVNLFLLAKHTLGPWISQSEESKIPIGERFATQWDQRKYIILNDLFWAIDNTLTFFKLKGNGFLGFAGNISTLLLLAFDLAAAIHRHHEEDTKHRAAMSALERAIEDLEDQIEEHSLAHIDAIKNDELSLWQAKQKDLQAQKDKLSKMKTKAKFEWKYKELSLANDCCYAIALLLAFCVVICFFCPPFAIPALTASIISLIGAILCFIVSTIYTARGCYLERSKTQEQVKLLQEEVDQLLIQFVNEKNSDLKKQLYLEIKSLIAETEYQKKVADFQLIKGIRSVVIDAMFPLVTFVSLVFIPLGIGIAVIFTAIAISIISNAILNQYAPEAAELPDFDEVEYKAFKKNPHLSLFEENESQKKQVFFATQALLPSQSSEEDELSKKQLSFDEEALAL